MAVGSSTAMHAMVGHMHNFWMCLLLTFQARSDHWIPWVHLPLGKSALTSMLANIFKTMWLHRLVPVIDKHLSHCQGGFRVGSGVKEQLWALLEFMEEGDNDETERIFCTTDVHKVFDQVYRNGTIYLLYGVECMVLNFSHVGKRLRMSNPRTHLGCEVPLER